MLKIKLPAVFAAVLLLFGCASGEPNAGPSPTEVADSPTPMYTLKPSEKLADFIAAVRDFTTEVRQYNNAPDNEPWRKDALRGEFAGGVEMTFDEFAAFGSGFPSGKNRWIDEIFRNADYPTLTPEEYALISYDHPVNNLALKGLNADVNSDGTDEVVLVTRTGGGSEGGSVIVFEQTPGGYTEKFNYYVGMQSRFALAAYNGGIFLVTVHPNPIRSDDSGNGCTYVKTLSYSLDIRRLSAGWTAEAAFLTDGELSLPETGEIPGLRYPEDYE